MESNSPIILKTSPRRRLRYVAPVVLLIVAGLVLLYARFVNVATEAEQNVSKVAVSGSRELSIDVQHIQSRSTVSELSGIFLPKCGPAKPAQAPEECGVLQWKGFSETNPAASAWLAMSNSGTEACTVTITSLALSAMVQTAESDTPTRTVLSSSIQGAQMLTDGSNGEAWGMFMRELPPGSTFTIPANPHAYIHPFGPIVAVPETATEITLTYSADLTNGCVVSGGINTFEENALPNTNPPYTQNGSETDFIKEAIKTPWVTKTIDAKEPISYSIKRLPRDQRTGWQKETEIEVEPTQQ